MIYAPAFDRALGQPIAGSIPIPRAARLIISEGNYLLLRGGDWACARSEFDEVWYCDLAEGERVRRLVARHERFGKDHDAALAWAMGTDQRNADLISLTRSSADLVIGDVVFQGLQEAAHAYRAADVGAGGEGRDHHGPAAPAAPTLTPVKDEHAASERSDPYRARQAGTDADV